MVFGFLKSQQRRMAELVATMNGVDPKSISPITEAAEWLEDLAPDDERHGKVPQKLLQGRYYLFSGNREHGTVIRVTPDEIQVRLPFEMKLRNGLRLPTSHLYRAMPVDGLLAMGEQRAQKIIRKVQEKAGETFREHQRMCNACFKIINPFKYPGHPNKGILGPPAFKLIDCVGCEAGQLKDAAAAKAEAEEEAKKIAEEKKRQAELRKKNRQA